MSVNNKNRIWWLTFVDLILRCTNLCFSFLCGFDRTVYWWLAMIRECLSQSSTLCPCTRFVDSLLNDQVNLLSIFHVLYRLGWLIKIRITIVASPWSSFTHIFYERVASVRDLWQHHCNTVKLIIEYPCFNESLCSVGKQMLSICC